MDRVQTKDILEFVENFELGESLSDSCFLITGATGLIGSTLIKCLLALDQHIRIIAPVRSMSKAMSIFEQDANLIKLIECDVLSYDYNQIEGVDYIIHCAAPTSSRFFIEKPVETFETIIEGTRVFLNYAIKHSIKSIVYLSSLEVYGEINDDSISITEDIQGYLDPISVRSSYPMAKRAAENLCHLYAKEYNIPVKIARLTQTTGAGIAKDDNRVIAQFARLAAKGENIVLHTTGESSRPYCYTMDSVSAVLYILLRGSDGEAYNVANEDTYISARSMAEYLRDNFSSSIEVILDIKNGLGYAPVTKQRLSTQKLLSLGWKPRYSLYRIFENLFEYFKEKD
ncbi:NAD(P)-dependent oxidoreductase [Prevotella sp. RM4]|uniref:NAD-dependent epimerase/dehydratase family protein n=1 Tax=Prevotella sp. RM4 TaxID=1200547 RepID=UPI00051BB2FC|nr:NAD(P)-dependent oxidoreductase [Prevotella sp. RM4]